MLQSLLPIIVILSVGLLAVLAALSLLLFPKAKPFAPGLAFLAGIGACWALAISAMVMDPARWSRSAGTLIITFPAIWLAGLNLAKAWRARAA
jgi:hypothetical protein